MRRTNVRRKHVDLLRRTAAGVRLRRHAGGARGRPRADRAQSRRPGAAVKASRMTLVLAAALLSACANYGSVELAHSSHPFAGPPFGPRTDEDSLDRVNGCLGRERAGWYAEGCL